MRVSCLSSCAMAKDTEKLIRQLSLISYLMAERRPGHGARRSGATSRATRGMNEDAFARRFYADRAELDSLGIHLTVDKPADGFSEQENYSLAPGELPPAGDRVHRRRARRAADRADAARRRVRLRRAAAARAAADLLGPPEPARRARRSARSALGDHRVAPAARELSQRLAKVETAIFRRKTIEFDYYTMRARRDRRAQGRPVPPALPGRAVLPRRPLARARRRCASSASRASAARSPTRPRPSTTSSAPTDFDPRAYANRVRLAARRRRSAPPRSGSPSGSPGTSSATSAATATIDAGRRRRRRLRDRRTRTRASSSSWVLGLGEHARVARPAGAGRRGRRARSTRIVERHAASRSLGRAGAPPAPPTSAEAADGDGHGAPRGGDPPRALRAPGHARLDPDRGRPRRPSGSRVAEVCERLQISEQELREDVNVLNVVNFGGGAYVLYAEVADDGEIEVDPEPYSRQLRPPGAAAAGRGQGAGRGDRPDRRAPARGRARLARARRSSPRSAHDPVAARACRSPRAGGDDSDDRARRLARRSPSRRLLRDRVLQGRTRTSSPSARSSPTR